MNLVGHLRAELGNGETARQIVSALDAGGVPLLPVSIAATASRQGHPYPAAEIPAAPFGTTVICLGAGATPLVRRRFGDALFQGRRTVGVWWWETPTFPAHLQPSFDHIDELWAGSAFVADILRAAAPERVEVVQLPLHVARERPAPAVGRAELGLPEGFLFLTLFDHNSVLARKNPLGVIEAYMRAFPDGSGTGLVVKSINGDAHPEAHARVVAAAAGRPDIQVLDGYVGAEERDALMAACDAYVSLHRAEGFGITMLEAMEAGRPVVATGWSGNVDFMPEGTALLVDHRLVPVGDDAGPYPAGDRWAEPDLDHAAAHLRRLADDPAAAARLGAAGRAHVLSTLSAEQVGEQLAARLAQVGPQTPVPQGPLAEVVERLAAERRARRHGDVEVLELEREALAAERDGVVAERVVLEDALRRAEARVAAVEGSASWRLTRPLRAARGLRRRTAPGDGTPESR